MPFLRRRKIVRPARAARARANWARKRLARARVNKFRQPVQYFKRSAYTAGWITASNSSDQVVSFEFALSGLPSYTEFTTLYDQYMIKGAKFTLIPRFNVANSANVDLPSQVFSILDFDGTPPTTLNQMMQYENLKMTRGTDLHKRYLKPAVLPQVYNGITTGYSMKKNVWLDCSNDSIPHYGATVCIPQVNSLESIKYDLKVELYLAFKNVR